MMKTNTARRWLFLAPVAALAAVASGSIREPAAQVPSRQMQNPEPVASTAQTSERWKQILRARKSADWPAAAALLEVVERSDRNSYRLRQGDFLKATALRKLGRFKESEAALQRLLAEGTPLEPLALWQLFELAREQGQSAQALRWLQRYRSIQSPLADPDRADWEEAQLLRAPQPERALFLYRGLARRRNPFRRMAQLRRSEMEAGARLRRNLRLELIAEKQNDEPAYQAASKLAEDLAGLRPSEIADVADVLRLNRDLGRLRKTARYFLEHFAANSRVPFFSYLLGRAWMLDNRFEQAIRQFDETYQRFPADRWGIQSKYYTGHVYLSMEKYSDAAATYRQIIEKHPDPEWLAGAYSNQIDALRWNRQWEEALQVARQGAERLKAREAAGLYYAAGKIVMIDSPAEAIALFLKALQTGERGGLPPGLGRAELHYWIGRSNERTQAWEAAAASFLESAKEDTNYFGFVSRDWLRNLYATRPEVKRWSDAFAGRAAEAKLAGRTTEYREAMRNRYYSAPPAEAQAARADLLADLAQDPGWLKVSTLPLWPASEIDDAALRQSFRSIEEKAAAILCGLGFFQNAAAILAAAPAFGDKLQQALAAATYFAHDDHWGAALAQAQKLAALLPVNSPELMPPRLVEFFLPLPSSARALDAASTPEPELVASLILRESRFQPDAKSPAGARGLMQLMPSTAEAMVRELGLPSPSPEDLYDPVLSVRLGTAYLHRLFQQLKIPEMVVAAYNGGPDNVLRWSKKSPTFDPALFVADIGFAETKSYAMRVLGDARLYKIIYAR
ncbi:MAG: transglycosylase SLT domain-containing protein [Acidobacteria bacterium]|nr:transglycosylase SLT domain-containing protein [Acidobacteriota bacterium]